LAAAVFWVIGRRSFYAASGSPFRSAASSHKTGTELNEEPVVFLMADGFARSCRDLRVHPAAVAAAVAGLCLTLGACANLPTGPFAEPPVDVTSPIAADIQKLDPKHAAYPSFLNIPSQPDDVRPASAWTRNIFDTLRDRREAQALVVVYPQTLYGAEAFAQEARAKAAPPITPAEATAQADKTSAFAKAQKARATPPSPGQ
jgi:hypothetical protein